MRALRCAFTARPKLGMTNLHAPPFNSFTASLNSSSKNAAALFFDVLSLPAIYATILDLLIGFAISANLLLRSACIDSCAIPNPLAPRSGFGADAAGTIAALCGARQAQT